MLEAHERIQEGDYQLQEPFCNSVRCYRRQWCLIIDVGNGYRQDISAKFARMDKGLSPEYR